MDRILYKKTEMVFTHVIYAGSLLLLRTSVYPDDSSPYREKKKNYWDFKNRARLFGWLQILKSQWFWEVFCFPEEQTGPGGFNEG